MVWHTQGSGKSLSMLWFTQKVLAELMPQKGFTVESLAASLKKGLLAPETLDEAARAAALLGKPDAAERLADRVLSLVAEMPQQRPWGKAA